MDANMGAVALIVALPRVTEICSGLKEGWTLSVELSGVPVIISTLESIFFQLLGAAL
jgi:hypothetical protein